MPTTFSNNWLREHTAHLWLCLAHKDVNALMAMDVMIGNSSSELTKDPALRVPSVNIGSRQTGRLKAEPVIDCGPLAPAIIGAIKKALDPEF